MNVDLASSLFFLSRYTLSASCASDFDSSMAASGTGTILPPLTTQSSTGTWFGRVRSSSCLM